jgi:hypothetical protein
LKKSFGGKKIGKKNLLFSCETNTVGFFIQTNYKVVKLKVGDYVKIEDGVILMPEYRTENWAGKIVAIYPESETCLVQLDAVTLWSLSDDYLVYLAENWSDPYYFQFDWEELEKSPRRDNEEALATAVGDVFRSMMEIGFDLSDDDDDDDFDGYDFDSELEDVQETTSEWFGEFEKSRFFGELTERQKENANFIVSTFSEMAFNYLGSFPGDWEINEVKEICLEIAPGKITADIGTFEDYGPVLFKYFEFLGEEDYIDNPEELMKAVKKIEKKIVKQAANPDNWHMAKSIGMEMQESDVDINDPAAVDEFIRQFNEKMGKIMPFPLGGNRPAENPDFKNIGRNERVTVQYEDGTKKENVKFKYVENDLIDGKCKLIK